MFYNINKLKALIGIEPMKKVLTVLRNNLSAITPHTQYGRHDSNMLYVSYPKGATDQFVIYHLYLIFVFY